MLNKKSQFKIVSEKSENEFVTKELDNKMEFGVRIARHSILEEIKSGGKKNLVLSPLSFHIALNKLASGSSGGTLKQLLYFLESDSIAQLNAQSSLLMELATGDTDDNTNNNQNPFRPIICLVNGIWVSNLFSLKDSFKKLAQDVYKADVRSIDFDKQGAQVRDEINSWAKEASKGHIDPFITHNFGEHTVLVQANALYFKGTWVDTFYPDYTEDEDFHLLSGETIRVPFMKKYDTYKFYGSFDGFKLLKMEYHTGLDNKSFAMYIFLPDKKDGLQELVAKFNSDPRFFHETRELKYVELNKLFVAKLKFEYELDALESMKKLGLDKPFDPDLAEIYEIVEPISTIYVTRIIQKSYIEIDEGGTVAVAITESDDDMAYDLFSMPSGISFIADHPFLFTIKEDISGSVLFVGAALNPLP